VDSLSLHAGEPRIGGAHQAKDDLALDSLRTVRATFPTRRSPDHPLRQRESTTGHPQKSVAKA